MIDFLNNQSSGFFDEYDEEESDLLQPNIWQNSSVRETLLFPHPFTASPLQYIHQIYDDHEKPTPEDNPYDDFTYRAIDGSNSHEYGLGQAHTTFTTVAGRDYGDGYNSPAGEYRPSPREISNVISAQNGVDIPSTINASNFLWMWGQFIDHDIDLVAEGTGESFNIAVPAGDPYFDPDNTGAAEIPLTRTKAEPGTGTEPGNPRQQVNEITSFIDASNIYGSDAGRAAQLRDEGGYLKLSEGNYLPFDQNSGGFLAGDVRVNENVVLTSMHTLFAREHNRIVDLLKEKYPDMSAEALYQNAKATVEAELQIITYKEFLPLLLGEDALSDYQGYNSAVNPQITNEFSTAAYRIGHTMLSATIARMLENGDTAYEGNLELRDAFFNPQEILDHGFDSIMRGQAATHSQAIDTLITDEVRNFLFGEPGAGGFDLVSLNIQRGRDHGVPDLNSVRVAYGLEAYTDFNQITSDPELAAKLQMLYQDINDIDLFIGGLAEDHVSGAVVGETFKAILLYQFTALREGDLYWYHGRFEGEMLEDLESTTLSDIIQRNTDVKYLQQNVFITSERTGGTNGEDMLYGSDKNDLLLGFHDKDELYGKDGDDTLYGGHGKDRLYGGDGNDYLVGEEGKDYLYGENGDDILLYDYEDHYSGGSGHDTLLFKNDSGWFDLSKLNIHSGIDALDFNNGKEDTVYLDIEDILDISDNAALYIRGDDGQDKVIAHQLTDQYNGPHTPEVTEHGGIEYAVYMNGETSLYVELGLLVA